MIIGIVQDLVFQQLSDFHDSPSMNTVTKFNVLEFTVKM